MASIIGLSWQQGIPLTKYFKKSCSPINFSKSGKILWVLLKYQGSSRSLKSARALSAPPPPPIRVKLVMACCMIRPKMTEQENTTEIDPRVMGGHLGLSSHIFSKQLHTKNQALVCKQLWIILLLCITTIKF